MTTSGDTRQAILDSARDIYLRDGLAGLSMRKVARAARISATAIYRHFDSKEALLGAVTEDGFRLFAEYLWRALTGADPRERLVLAGMEYMRFGVEHAPYYRIIFMAPANELGHDTLPAESLAKISRTFQFLVDRVRECMDAGVIVAGDPVEHAASIWAHCHGLVSLYLAGRLADRVGGADAFAAFYRRSIERLLAGLQA